MAYHIKVTAPQGSESSAGSGSVSSLQPQSLNFSNISVNDSVLSTADSSVHLSPQKLKSPRQRKNTFTKEDSALDNLSETLSKALPHVDPVPTSEHGAIQFSARGEKRDEEKSRGFARGSAIRKSLPTTLGRGLKPPGAKSSNVSRPQGQVISLTGDPVE